MAQVERAHCGELAAGDLRGLYLGWLLSLRQGELDDDEPEPPPRPGSARSPRSSRRSPSSSGSTRI